MKPETLEDDILRGSTLFLMDVGMSKTATPSLSFAGRILPFDDFCMTSGAFITVQDDSVRKEIMSIVEKLAPRSSPEDEVQLTQEQQAALSVQIIRHLLRKGALDHTLYGDVGV